MSHPVPSHDSDNEYPADKVTHYPRKAKHKALKKKAGMGSSEEAHLTILKGAGRHMSKYHDKKGCSVCSKFQ